MNLASVVARWTDAPLRGPAHQLAVRMAQLQPAMRYAQQLRVRRGFAL